MGPAVCAHVLGPEATPARRHVRRAVRLLVAGRAATVDAAWRGLSLPWRGRSGLCRLPAGRRRRQRGDALMMAFALFTPRGSGRGGSPCPAGWTHAAPDCPARRVPRCQNQSCIDGIACLPVIQSALKNVASPLLGGSKRTGVTMREWLRDAVIYQSIRVLSDNGRLTGSAICRGSQNGAAYRLAGCGCGVAVAVLHLARPRHGYDVSITPA